MPLNLSSPKILDPTEKARSSEKGPYLNETNHSPQVREIDEQSYFFHFRKVDISRRQPMGLPFTRYSYT